MADNGSTLVDVKCVVCGQGSTRSDWQDGKPHACDSHSPAEVRAALASQGFGPSPAAPPPAPNPSKG